MVADVYCDKSLTTGLNDGTSWVNAYQSLVTALDNVNNKCVLVRETSEHIKKSITKREVEDYDRAMRGI